MPLQFGVNTSLFGIAVKYHKYHYGHMIDYTSYVFGQSLGICRYELCLGNDVEKMSNP